jgi:hypothetical protein
MLGPGVVVPLRRPLPWRSAGGLWVQVAICAQKRTVGDVQRHLPTKPRSETTSLRRSRAGTREGELRATSRPPSARWRRGGRHLRPAVEYCLLHGDRATWRLPGRPRSGAFRRPAVDGALLVAKRHRRSEGVGRAGQAVVFQRPDGAPHRLLAPADEGHS